MSSAGQRTTSNLMEVLFARVEREHAAALSGGSTTIGRHTDEEARQLKRIYDDVQKTADLCGGQMYAKIADIDDQLDEDSEDEDSEDSSG